MSKKQTFVCVVHDAFILDRCMSAFVLHDKNPPLIFTQEQEASGADFAGPRDQKANKPKDAATSDNMLATRTDNAVRFYSIYFCES